MNADELRKILDDHKVYLGDLSKVECRAKLIGANLSGYDLRGVDLMDADLRLSDLRGADLRGADLRDVNLSGADLRGADLSEVDLRDSVLRSTKLNGANLMQAKLRGSDLRGADLRYSNLKGADLIGAYLLYARLPDRTYLIMGEEYPISITHGEYLLSACQNHTIEDWRKFTKCEIEEMGGNAMLKFYPRLLDIADFYLGKGERPEWLNELDSED